MNRARSIGVGLAAVSLILTGCGSSTRATSSAADGSSSAATDHVPVVASTNVWGDIVSQIGGVHVGVTSIIADPAADPHSYEADAQNQLAISKARLIVENGGGYDDFVDNMIKSAGNGAAVINAVTVSGKPAGNNLNEHVWYDFPTVMKVAEQIEQDLSRTDSAHAADYLTATASFVKRLTALEAKEAAIKARSAGIGVAITEPVPVYMLESSGLVNKTPEKFSAAIESETDVPADVLAQTLKLFTDRKIKALVYNEQTTGPQTAAVLKAAKDNAIVVVPVTETLPKGQDYLSWMSGNLDALARAVS